MRNEQDNNLHTTFNGSAQVFKHINLSIASVDDFHNTINSDIWARKKLGEGIKHRRRFHYNALSYIYSLVCLGN